jgi:hypothetical protein
LKTSSRWHSRALRLSVVVGEHEDAGSGVGSADADVVELAVVAEGELAVDVDAVGADPVVAGSAGLAWDGLGPGVVGDSGVWRCGRDRCGRRVL